VTGVARTVFELGTSNKRIWYVTTTTTTATTTTATTTNTSTNTNTTNYYC